ncbi:MAG: bacterial transcriptional activator domain-containing protein [Anaerolineae bacterium]
MWRDSLTSITIEDFKSAIDGKKVVIFYPQISYRNLFLAYLLECVDQPILYYCVKSHETHIIPLLNGLLSELALDFPQTTDAIASEQDTATIATAFSAELATYDTHAVLYLDELDRIAVDDEVYRFFLTLIDNLSGQNKLVINARQLTLDPWQKAVLEGDAVVIGTEKRRSQLMFNLDESDKPQLEIYAFGSGQVIMNGLAVDSWDGILPRNLFFFFIDRDAVTRNEIFENFWPTLNMREATNVFHVTKRKISERLSEHVMDRYSYDLTTYANGFYHPSDAITRHYDVAEFEEMIERASMTFKDDARAELYRRAISLYQAPFLLSIDMPWVVERRDKLQRLLLEALVGLARIYKDQERYEESLGYFMRAIHELPMREDIHREVMVLYQLLGHPQEAIRQYNLLETLLHDMLGVAPAQETKQLLQTINA